MSKHPEIQEEAKELCGQEIVIKEELYPEYVVFVYDSVITIAKGMQAVLDNNPNATFLCEMWSNVMNSFEETRKELYDEVLKVQFEGQSGTVQFKPGVGDRLPVKLEVVNIHVWNCLIVYD